MLRGFVFILCRFRRSLPQEEKIKPTRRGGFRLLRDCEGLRSRTGLVKWTSLYIRYTIQTLGD